MGHEVTVTALQLACAISAIANDGVLLKPRIISAIKDKNGEVIKEFPVQKSRRVVSPQTARTVREFLRGVVEEGTGKAAEIKGFYPAGKTGTAQKIEPTGGYSHKRFVASFIGFVPWDKPIFSIVVIVDEPRPYPYYYGGVVAAPVFKRVATDIMQYVGMPKTEPYEKVE
jgi:cell division protein FtsI/penicillin-binding protein 2